MCFALPSLMFSSGTPEKQKSKNIISTNSLHRVWCTRKETLWQKKLLITWHWVGRDVFILDDVCAGPSKICHIQKVNYYIIKSMHLHAVWLSAN